MFAADLFSLNPDRHPQSDFFIADLIEVAPRDDMPSMEHPLFALKAGDRRQRVYERQGVRVAVKPGFDGCATAHDKDIWIYAVSQLAAAMNNGQTVSRTVRFKAYDFLVATNRPTSGVGYERMAAALARLRGTSIETNIETAGHRERRGFGLIDEWKVIERDRDERMVAIEVTLPDWLFRSVQQRQMLTLSRDYFRIRKPLERRLYELARKHCGRQDHWRVSLAVLHEKSGSASALKKFRLNLKELAQRDDLPDYRFVFDEAGDAVTVYPRNAAGQKAELKDVLNGTGEKRRGEPVCRAIESKAP